MKSKEYIDGLQKKWNEVYNKLTVLQNEKHSLENEIIAAVKENVDEQFTEFNDGDKVKVTLQFWDPDPCITVSEKVLFFHKPVKIPHLKGCLMCDYEIPFHAVNKDGSENKRNDLYDNHIPITRIVKMEKVG